VAVSRRVEKKKGPKGREGMTGWGVFGGFLRDKRMKSHNSTPEKERGNDASKKGT